MITEELFIEVDGLPVFNPEAKLLKEFKVLIERDKGSPGDSQGRKKLIANRELAFIALYSSLKSPYNRNYEPEARVKELKRDLELPPKWEIDDSIESAIRLFQRTQKTPSSEMLTAVRDGLFKSRDIVIMLQNRLDITMKKLHEMMLVESLDFEEEEAIDKYLKRAMDYIETLLKYSKNITDQLSTLETLENKYVKEMEEMKGKNKTIVNKHQLPD